MDVILRNQGDKSAFNISSDEVSLYIKYSTILKNQLLLSCHKALAFFFLTSDKTKKK